MVWGGGGGGGGLALFWRIALLTPSTIAFANCFWLDERDLLEPIVSAVFWAELCGVFSFFECVCWIVNPR